MSNKDIQAILDYLEKEKGIERALVASAIEEALLSSASVRYEGGDNLFVAVDSKTGEITIRLDKTVVEKVKNPLLEVAFDQAYEVDPTVTLGEVIAVDIPPHDLGRIAASKARQLLNTRLRSAERDVIHAEYRDRIGDIVSGTVKRKKGQGTLIVDLGKIEAVMPLFSYPKTESYFVGDKVVALLEGVVDLPDGGAEVRLSRSSPGFVVKLFEQEVPELKEGQVMIHYVVREAGYRTKVVVSSDDPRIDPVGTCVGLKGIRVKGVIQEMNNEKIDIIPYHADPLDLLQQALDPVQIQKIKEAEEQLEIVVDDEDYPVVLGKRGINARLCGQLMEKELIVHRASSYRQSLQLEAKQLSLTEDERFDAPFEIDGLNTLIKQELTENGYTTYRDILGAKIETLIAQGISREIGEQLFEQVISRVKSFD